MIIIIELLLIWHFRNRLKKIYNIIDVYLLLAFAFQLTMLVLYRFELHSIRREVYFSDAEYYWSATLRLLNGKTVKSLGSQYGYVLWCYLIQKTSLFIWPGWNNISNILLYDLAALIMACCISTVGDFKSLPFILCNPLAIYGIMRNLKDGFFAFLTALIMLAYFSYHENKVRISLLFAVVIDIFISTIRPWGFLILPTIYISTYLWDIKNAETNSISIRQARDRIIVVVVSLLFVFYYFKLYDHLRIWIPIILERTINRNVASTLTAPFRMLTGPGVYRAINGNEYFMYNLKFATYSVAIGCFMWWCSLSKMLTNLNGIKISRSGSAFLSVFFLFIIIYSLQYGGSVEHRMRSVLYLLGSTAFFSNYNGEYNISSSTIVVFFAIAIFATVFSI